MLLKSKKKILKDYDRIRDLVILSDKSNYILKSNLSQVYITNDLLKKIATPTSKKNKRKVLLAH